MKLCELDLSDVYPRYARELEAFRGAACAVARDIFCEHMLERLASEPLPAVREAAPLFGKRLLDYLLDTGDIAADEAGRVRPAPDLARRAPSKDVVAAYAAEDPRRSSLAYFLTACREIAGGVLAGSDGFRLVRLRDPRGVMERWEHVMLEAPILEPCRVFAARALASRMTAPLVVLEGGAGVGVVLRTLLADPLLSVRVGEVAAYHYTDIDPALLSVGKARIARAAPEVLRRSMVYRALDLDALARDPAASGLSPGSVDCIVLEHVLYDVEDLHATLSTFRRLLRPTGALIFTGAFRGRAATFFPCEMLQLTLASYRRARLDPPYRANAGYLSSAEWALSLSRAGFKLSLLPALDDHERMPHGGVLATLAVSASSSPAPSAGRPTLPNLTPNPGVPGVGG